MQKRKKDVKMATISTRIDDETKKEAERVADNIGITLSSAISIFLKQFVNNNGFPFDVVAQKKEKNDSVVNLNILDESVKKAVSDPKNSGMPSHFTFISPESGKTVTVVKE